MMSPSQMPKHYNDFDACVQHAYELLSQGQRDRHHGFRVPTLITNSQFGHQGRIVVLRGWNPEKRELSFYTDTRTNLYQQILEDPTTTWIFYDRPSKVQLRVQAKAVVHHQDELATACWATVGVSGRRAYMAHCAPGSESELPVSGLHPRIEHGQLTQDDHHFGFSHFSVVTAVVHSMEWLYLTALGNRRARFAWGEDSTRTSTWLIP